MTAPGSNEARLQMAQTRRRLSRHLHEGAALAAPARLVATGMDAVKDAAASRLFGALRSVSGVLRPGSPWVALALTVTSAVLRRR